MTDCCVCLILPFEVGCSCLVLDERVCMNWSTWPSSSCALCASQSESGCRSITRLHKASQQIPIDCSREEPLLSAIRTSTNLGESLRLTSQTWLSCDNTNLLRFNTKMSISLSYTHCLSSLFSCLDNCATMPIGHNIANCLPCFNKSNTSLKLPSVCMIPM